MLFICLFLKIKFQFVIYIWNIFFDYVLCKILMKEGLFEKSIACRSLSSTNRYSDVKNFSHYGCKLDIHSSSTLFFLPQNSNSNYINP